MNADTRIGFERTLEQDVAFGIRQQIDIASKALSAAINDPYTAVQSIDRLTAVCCDLAVAEILTDPDGGPGQVIVPANTFGEYLTFICGLVGRYGARDFTVMMALLRRSRAAGMGSPAHPRGSRADRARRCRA